MPSESDLETRIARLEQAIVQLEHAAPESPPFLNLPPYWPLLSGILALAFGYLGMALPHHYFQYIFAGLILIVSYHRHYLHLFAGYWRWPLVIINYALWCLFFKLMIGAGEAHPLTWLKMPTITSNEEAESSSWLDKMLPNYDFSWQGVTNISDFAIDITQIQTLLLLLTLIGAAFRFQPFASMTAILLLIISIPSFMAFQWEWVILFLIFTSVTFYLQIAHPKR